MHQANLPSGGHVSRIELAEFLSLGHGPEQQSLLRLIGTLLDRAPEHLISAAKVIRAFRSLAAAGPRNREPDL